MTYQECPYSLGDMLTVVNAFEKRKYSRFTDKKNLQIKGRDYF